MGAGGHAAIVSGVDVDALAATVRSCHFVSDLAAGRPGSAATYLPGRRVQGIAVDDARVRIQVRSRWAAPAHAVVAEVLAAARPLVGDDRTIDVTIADIDDPPGRRWPPSEDDPTTTSLLTASAVPEQAQVAGAPAVGHPPAR